MYLNKIFPPNPPQGKGPPLYIPNIKIQTPYLKILYTQAKHKFGHFYLVPI